jgi:SNF family Na+-dependent transporter|tara:strand:+ start:3739 stop:3933 length:195 start_codon:yes stop_codon:yes gene_type:complete
MKKYFLILLMAAFSSFITIYFIMTRQSVDTWNEQDMILVFNTTVILHLLLSKLLYESIISEWKK